MMLQRLLVRYRPWWLLVFPLLAMMIGLANAKGTETLEMMTQGLIGWFLGWLLSLLIGMFFPICTLRLFFERRTLRIRSIAARIMSALFLTGFMGGFLLSRAPSWMQWIPPTAFTGWLIGLVATLTLNRRLSCRRKSGGMFEIRGFHPRALESLAAKP